ncbi:hypothetical protein, partial [Saccharothrix longispora]|uniref:hypothetical protein n=1 Tax=Saccharothrix longispora TaxID=33920 RepID=UPI0028FD0341
MSRSVRVWVVVVVVVVLGFGALFVVLGLDGADKISSGIGAATGIVGLFIALRTVLRDAPTSPASNTSSVDGTGENNGTSKSESTKTHTQKSNSDIGSNALSDTHL